MIAAFAVTVAIGLLRGAPESADIVEPVASGAPSVAIDGARVYVHVAGAVNDPGLYALPADARVVDAVAAASGFADGADTTAVNLARTVSDGEQIVVALVGAEPPAAPPVAGSGGGSGAAAEPGAVIDLNTADATALDTLPRIGPALAERIIAWREENGRFASVDDLLAVPGIGEKLVAGLRDLVRV